jgi:hypothetical protein
MHSSRAVSSHQLSVFSRMPGAVTPPPGARGPCGKWPCFRSMRRSAPATGGDVAERPCHSERTGGPSGGCAGRDLCEGDAGLPRAGRGDADDVVGAGACRGGRPVADREGEDEPGVVVGVLADQVRPAGSGPHRVGAAVAAGEVAGGSVGGSRSCCGLVSIGWPRVRISRRWRPGPPAAVRRQFPVRCRR